MKTFVAGLIFVVITVAGNYAIPAGPQETKAEPIGAGPFMRAKLVASQDVLNGLVTENFGLIRRAAEDMKRMSQAVQWPTADDEIYNHYGIGFRQQCDKLMQLADDQNLQGAHYTWLHMTTTCIDCHSYVRGAFRVEPNANDPQGPIRLIPTDWEGRTYKKNRPGEEGNN